MKRKIRQWLINFLHPIVWDDLGLRVVKRESDNTWSAVLELRRELAELKEKIN